MFQRWRRFLEKVFEPTLRLLPEGLRWRQTQSAYIQWSRDKLPPEYMAYLVERGQMFAEFVGEPGPLVDVGCGNGLIGGVPYVKTGYSPIRRGCYPILGIDPLPLEAPIPWITRFKQMRCEDYAELGYRAATFVTSFDHLRDPAVCLTRLRLYGVKKLYLWETLWRVPPGGDWHHAHRYTYVELRKLLNEMGYRIVRAVKVDENTGSGGWFIEAEEA